MEKKISFDKLRFLTSHVDYLFQDSYPFQFKVVNGDDERFFEIGIGDVLDNEEYSDIINGEGQYIAEIAPFEEDDIIVEYISVLELVQCDLMTGSGITESLKTLCNINKDSEIFLLCGDGITGFDGMTGEFTMEYLTQNVIDYFEESINLDDEEEEDDDLDFEI